MAGVDRAEKIVLERQNATAIVNANAKECGEGIVESFTRVYREKEPRL